MATISFKTTFDLSTSPKQFVIEDLSDYIGQGIAEADVNGCFKEIISPSGIPYYANVDFSDIGCDIQIAVDRVNKIVIPLPQVGGVVELGDYTITYRVYNKDTDEYYEVSNTYTYGYTRKTITITQNADCLSPRFTSTDTTSYAIAGATLTLIRQHTVNFPYGSAGESTPISGPLATYGTSVFYNGTQTTEIASSVEYLFADGLTVRDYLTGSREILVSCEDTCAIMCCIKAAWNRLKGFRTSNKTEYNLLLPVFNLAVSDLVLLMRSQSCGMATDMSQYLEEIKTLLNCTDDCCTDGTTPTQVVGLGNINVVVVESGDAVVEVEVEVDGTTTIYTITLAEAFVAKVNSLWASIVVAGENITSVGVVTNPDGTKTYTINGKKSVIVAGDGITVAASAEVAGVTTYTVTNDISAGDNVSLSGTNPIVINGKKAIVVSGTGISVTPSSEVAGVITYTIENTAPDEPDTDVNFQVFYLPGTTTRELHLAAGVSNGEILYFVYPGSTSHRTPTRIKLVAKSDVGGADALVTIEDVTNSNNWINNAAVTIPTTVGIIDLGVPSNIDAAEALIRVEMKAPTAGDLTGYSLLIEY